MSEELKQKYINTRNKIVYEMLNGKKITFKYDGKDTREITESTITVNDVTFNKKDLHKHKIYFIDGETTEFILNEKPQVKNA